MKRKTSPLMKRYPAPASVRWRHNAYMHRMPRRWGLWDELLAWKAWHRGIPNAPPIPSEQDIARQKEWLARDPEAMAA